MQRLVSSILQHVTPERLLAIFLLLTVPMVFAPFFTDDFFHLLMLGENPPLPRPDDGSLWGLFSFIDNSAESRRHLMQQGVLPWWTGENFYFRFWRPAAELTHWADYRLAPGSALVAHLHSSLWFIGLSLVIFRIYGKLAGDRRLAWLALVIFFLDGNHAPTIEWIANRNALVSGFFAALCLYFHILYRERHAARFYLLAIIMLGIALSGGESAIAIGGFLFAYAVFLDRRGLLQGVVSLLPYAVLVIAWFVQYKALGYGANGSAIHYVDIASMPVEFARVVFERVPVYLFSAFGLIPAEVYPALKLVFAQEYQKGIFAAVLMPIIFITAIMWPYITKLPLLRFALSGSVLATVPFCAVINQDRLSLLPGIGFDLAIAIIIYQVVIRRNLPWKPEWLNETVRLAAVVLSVLHLLLSPLLLFAESAYIAANAKKTEADIMRLENSVISGKKVVILKSPVTQAALLKPVRIVNGAEYPDSVWLLSGGKGELTIQRVSENRVSVARSIGFVEGFEQSFRDLAHLPFRVGDAVDLDGIRIVVSEVNASGQPLRIECHFAESIDSGRYLFLTMDKNNGFTEVFMPAAGFDGLVL